MGHLKKTTFFFFNLNFILNVAGRIIMLFNKETSASKILLLRRNNLGHQNLPMVTHMKICFAEVKLGILVDKHQ